MPAQARTYTRTMQNIDLQRFIMLTSTETSFSSPALKITAILPRILLRAEGRKALLTCWLAVLQLAFSVSAHAIDAPHNASSNMSCDSCHDPSLQDSPLLAGAKSTTSAPRTAIMLFQRLIPIPVLPRYRAIPAYPQTASGLPGQKHAPIATIPTTRIRNSGKQQTLPIFFLPLA